MAYQHKCARLPFLGRRKLSSLILSVSATPEQMLKFEWSGNMQMHRVTRQSWAVLRYEEYKNSVLGIMNKRAL